MSRAEGTVRIDRYPGPVAFDAVMVEGLGHHWPGGRGQLNPRLAGPPSDAVNATEMILRQDAWGLLDLGVDLGITEERLHDGIDVPYGARRAPEMAHVLDSFPLVPIEERVACLNEFRAIPTEA